MVLEFKFTGKDVFPCAAPSSCVKERAKLWPGISASQRLCSFHMPVSRSTVFSYRVSRHQAMGSTQNIDDDTRSEPKRESEVEALRLCNGLGTASRDRPAIVKCSADVTVLRMKLSAVQAPTIHRPHTAPGRSANITTLDLSLSARIATTPIRID